MAAMEAFKAPTRLLVRQAAVEELKNNIREPGSLRLLRALLSGRRSVRRSRSMPVLPKLHRACSSWRSSCLLALLSIPGCEAEKKELEKARRKLEEEKACGAQR